MGEDGGVSQRPRPLADASEGRVQQLRTGNVRRGIRSEEQRSDDHEVNARRGLTSPPASADVTPDEIAAAAIRGEKSALGEVYRLLSPRVRGYLAVRGAKDPDGTTNDVFVQVIQRIDTVTGGWAGLTTFVFTVAHARLVDELRLTAKRRSEEYVPDEDPRRYVSAEETAVDRIASGDVLGVLDLLPDDQRTVVTLRVLADLTIDQAAAVMARSPSNVSALQARALTALRGLLAERGGSDELGEGGR